MARRAIARGPVARAARYDARRALIVISLEGEFSFPTAVGEGLTDAPRSKLKKIEISPNGLGLHWPLYHRTNAGNAYFYSTNANSRIPVTPKVTPAIAAAERDSRSV